MRSLPYPLKTKPLLLLALTLAALLLSGCASYLNRKEMEAVARDWCLVVRASQVLPVFPLIEDLQPGDVFLVTTSIGQEARLYARRAFLPLDQHLARLQPLDFQAFYQKSFGGGGFLTSGRAPGNGGRRYARSGVGALARNIAREGTDDHHP